MISQPLVPETGVASRLAQERLLSLPGEPLFLADWDRALMIHYEVDRSELEHVVPFEIDLIEGKAFVSTVSFTLRHMRPRIGARLLSWIIRPIANHHFLNVRTYVRHRGEKGIYFLAEWLSNRLSVVLGPIFFGLPYRYASISYNHRHEKGVLAGHVLSSDSATFEYRASIDPLAVPRDCASDSLVESLMERYTAFTNVAGKARFFRVWHPSWQQQPADVTVLDQSLLKSTWKFFHNVHPFGANYSPGLKSVWMGWPHPITAQ